MPCCGNTDGTPRATRKTVFVVLNGNGEVAEVWPSVPEARRSAANTGRRWQPRAILLDGSDPLYAMLPQSGCRGCG